MLIIVTAAQELEDSDTFGICSLDAATGEFNLCSFVDDVCRTKLETMLRQLRPKELIHTKVSESCTGMRRNAERHHSFKGNLSAATVRLLKNILPSSCLWTTLRESEGLTYEDTIEALNELFPADEDGMDEDAAVSSGIPEGIRSMLDSRPAVEAIGQMVWYLRQLNIDKDLVSQKNFNIYDPMKQGKGLVLDGQTLSHIEVLQNSEGALLRVIQTVILCSLTL